MQLFSSRGDMMNWNEIERAIQEIIADIREKCIIQNTAIKDDIFGILENNCTVIYYPMENEKNRGFHIKRIVKKKLEDFVYINTAKPIEEQIFTAAHEFGHIFEVAEKVWKKLEYDGKPTEDEEEELTNRFAAELLMPSDAFRKLFFSHMEEVGLKSGRVKLEDLVRVIVMQMTDFMVPYEAVRKRLVETKLMQPQAAVLLITKEILQLVTILSKDQNSYLENRTGIKTISGIRTLIEKAESDANVDDYLIKKIKKDLEMADMPEIEQVEIHIGDGGCE